jgi:hypothetical protein
MDDKRAAPRMRSFLKGRVIFNGGASSLDCLIRDISATGARLELSGSITLPERFDLYLPHRDETCKVQVQWRRDDHIGIAFIAANQATSPAASPDLQLRVQQLETEVALLRLMLEQMRLELGGLKQGNRGTHVA